MVASSIDDKYFFLPFWFEKTDEEGVYIFHYLDMLPDKIKDKIRGIRFDQD